MVQKREGGSENEGCILCRLENRDGGSKKGAYWGHGREQRGGLETEGRIVSRLENRDRGLKKGAFWERGREQRGGLKKGAYLGAW